MFANCGMHLALRLFRQPTHVSPAMKISHTLLAAICISTLAACACCKKKEDPCCGATMGDCCKDGIGDCCKPETPTNKK